MMIMMQSRVREEGGYEIEAINCAHAHKIELVRLFIFGASNV